MEVPNRISFSAHLTNLAEHGLPTKRLTDYLAARARGGTGLIITEEQSVHPTDQAYEHLIEAFRPEVVAGYRDLTRAVHEFDTRIFAQLNHNGQQCSGHLSRLPVWAPSAIPDVLYREVPKAMEPEDIARGDRLLLPLRGARARGGLRRRGVAVRAQFLGAAVHVAPHELPQRRVRRRRREAAPLPAGTGGGGPQGGGLRLHVGRAPVRRRTDPRRSEL